MMSISQIGLYIAYSFAITFVLIAIRLFWVYSKSGVDYFKALASPNKYTKCPQIIREATIVGWAGMRGIVSLAAALALPYASSNGNPIEGRDEVIFITFVVILITLLVPSSTLAHLIHLLKMNHHVSHHEGHQARKRLVEIAKEKINHLHKTKNISDKDQDFLLNYFALQRHIFEISGSSLKKMSNLEIARLKVFEAQRNKLLEMWEQQEIDDRLFRQLEHELDVAESHIARAELK